MTLVAGLDVGGSKTLGLVTAADGRPVAEIRLVTEAGTPETLLDFVTEAVAKLAGDAGIAVGDLGAIGIGIPGLVDPATGGVRDAVNLGLGRATVPVGAHLRSATGVPTTVANDVDAAAVGASHLLGRDDLAYLSVGTGVAAGLVLDGRLRRGRRGAAGEIGHLVVDPSGPECVCGQRGCLEALVAGPAIARRWPVAAGASPAAALVDAASAGDVSAVEALAEVAGYLASGVALLGLTVDPDVVVLGGGVAEAGEPLRLAVADALSARAARSDLLRDLDLAGRLALLGPDAAAGAIGAALLARDGRR